MRCAVAIFAKTVGVSDVKTRLAADIGTEKAEAFFKLSVDCVEGLVAEAGEAFPEAIYPVWVVAEEDGPSHWANRPFPAIWTGEGGLGSRLANVSEHLFGTYDAVMMIGTDSPQLSPTVIVDAVSRLAGGVTQTVVGPAADGGFYLFASRQPVARESWESVTYSTDTTLSELETHLSSHQISSQRLVEEQDVDTLGDLKMLRKVLGDRSCQLNAPQLRLREWLEQNSELF